MVVTQTMLDEARQAYHSLMLGQGVAEFRDQNGESVRYTKADIGKLASYIEYLERELGVAKSTAGPMQVWF